MNRRKFIKRAASTSVAFSIVPSFVLGKNHIPPSDKLYVACFGVGGRGASVIGDLAKLDDVTFVAFCDVDDRQAKQTYQAYPNVKTYRDFREVFARHLGDIDAVMIATPDHTHASIALPFMREKKHAYVEKPLAHNIFETRLMSRVAKEQGIITQMGNQGASGEGMRQTQEYIQSGVIGEVNKVDCWTNRPVWPQGNTKPLAEKNIRRTLDWDLWLGPAEYRPYNEGYLPFKWRGWWDFGTGALGDMGCHIMDAPFKALKLKSPKEVEASCTTTWTGDFIESNYSGACPPSSIVKMKFDTQGGKEVELNWHDGGIAPSIPEELKYGETIGDRGGGNIFYGSEGLMIVDTYGENPRLLPSERVDNFFPPSPSISVPRVANNMSGHVENWVRACTKDTQPSSPFSYAGFLTEGVLIGNLAIKAYQYKVLEDGKKATDWDPYTYPGRTSLKWNGEKTRFENLALANQWIKRDYRKGWELK